MEIKTKKINYNLEALRGLAGLIVVFDHIIFWHIYFDANYFPTVLKKIEPSGHFAVLIFFVLSGYVIGVNHKEALVGSNLLIYLRKRFVRIYPIYFIAILLGLIVSVEHYSLMRILANFTLTQNVFYEVIWANGPAWSLNYEILFYLLFIPISYFKIKPLHAIIFFLIIGTINVYLPFNPIITSYAFGYCFWLLGLFAAGIVSNSESKLNLWAFLFYILAIGNIIINTSFFTISRIFSIFKSPISKIGKWTWAQNEIALNDLILLPFCFMIVFYFSEKHFKYKNLFFHLINIIPLYIIFRTFYSHNLIDSQFYVSLTFLVLSLLISFFKINDLYLHKLLLKLGGISYGIYIIHFPIFILCGRIPISNDNLFFYVIRIIIYLTVTLISAWILEKKFQPWVKKILIPQN